MTLIPMPTESSETIAQWGSETFGNAASVKAYAIRAQEELAELIEAIESGDTDKAIASEAADITILLHRITGTLGLELYDAVDEKMAVNKRREWVPDGSGVGRHQ
ncbi:dATP/dGTP pyrophosphohydrolase domain-containing protein [Hellea balneolensis]|uniref:dATP/dGTP pyrophosphohydrolase domain-containing protein n=1 Tax=Hellea balneolensis TaxID=287478 RepID=UPI00047C2CE0|nr:dATP/dGTP pyrophosphohydrolase domain-containing protein [Hellea balneolensis]